MSTRIRDWFFMLLVAIGLSVNEYGCSEPAREVDPRLAAWEFINSDPNDPPRIVHEPYGYRGNMPADWNAPPEPVDDEGIGEAKQATVFALLNGWAVDAHLEVGPDDNEIFKPNVTSYGTSFLTAASEIRSYCGAWGDSNPNNPDRKWYANNAYLPCILIQSSSHNLAWNIDWSGCPSTAPTWQTAIVNNSIREYMNQWSIETGWPITENGSNRPKVTFACANNTEASYMAGTEVMEVGAVMAGFPTGTLARAFRAITAGDNALGKTGLATLSVCTEQQDPQFGVGYASITDEYHYYQTGRVIISWDALWATIQNCPQYTDGNSAARSIKQILGHELGHVFGFSHQWDEVSTENIMWGTRNCGWMFGGNNGHWRNHMIEAVRDMKVPFNQEPLQFVDEGLQCDGPR
jgi:hypothetical protein